MRKYRQEAEDNYNKENPVPLRNLVDKDEILKSLISSAVSKAIDECIQENVLKDFFLTYRQEVIDMSYSECTAEEQLEIIANDRYETGFNNGFSNGSKKTANLFAWLLSSKRYDDAQKASSDPEFLEQLMTEYDSCHDVQ
nr:hypothetical protein [uncultured Butyrivibrio sp.]